MRNVTRAVGLDEAGAWLRDFRRKQTKAAITVFHTKETDPRVTGQMFPMIANMLDRMRMLKCQ